MNMNLFKDKKGQLKKLSIALSLLLIFSLCFVMALPDYIQITPTENLTTSNLSQLLNYNYTVQSDQIKSIEFYLNSQQYISNINPSFSNGNYTLNYGNNSNLLVYYMLDNSSILGENNTHIVDLSSNSYNGTAINAIPTSNGKHNGAFYFDGGGDYIQIDSLILNDLSMYKNFTIMGWVYWGGKASQDGKIFTLWNTTNDQISCGIGYDDDILACNLRNDTGYIGQTKSDFALTKNQWYFFAYTQSGEQFDGDDGMFLYINGESQSAYGNTGDSGNTYGARLGAPNYPNNYFNGSIDDFKIYDKTLTKEEINTIYSSEIIKYDSENYSLSVLILDKTLSNSTGNKEYEYYSCITNQTDFQNCSSSFKIISTPIINMLTPSNFSSPSSIIRDGKYGIDLFIWGAEHSWMDTTGDNSLDSQSNYTWHQETFLNSKSKLVRLNFELDNLVISEGVYDLTTNTSNYRNMLARKEQVRFAYENNISVMATFAIMVPTYFRNQSSIYCNSSNYRSCPPINDDWDGLGDIIREVIDFVTENGTYNSIKYVELGNEVYGTTWLNALPTDDPIKSREYVKLFNASRNEIRSVYPNIKVCGASSHFYSVSPNFYNTFISNLSGNFDCITFHTYQNYVTGSKPLFNTTMSNITSLCNTYGANCSDIIVSEYNNGVLSISGNNIQQSLQNALYYWSSLTYFPQLAEIYFTWQWKNPLWGGYNSGYIYDMVSEPEVNNTIFGNYYTTKYFAEICPERGEVIESEQGNDVYQLNCKKGNMKSFIFINLNDNYAYNQKINLTDTGITSLYNYETRENLTITDNIADLGIIDSSGIGYFVEDLQVPSITFLSPINNSNYTRYSIPINITLDEDGSWCGYSLDGASNITMNQEVVLYKFNYLLQYISEGSHSLVINCNDTFNNFGSNEINFNVYRYPLVSLIYPDGNIITNINSLSFVYNFSDDSLLSYFKHNYNSINYSIYDNSLVLFTNLDNRSSLNEDDLNISDLSIYENDGKVYGASFIENGKYNGAYSFDGANDYIEINDDSSLRLNNSNDFSIFLWVNKQDNEEVAVLHKFTRWASGYRLMFRTDNDMAFHFYTNEGGSRDITFNNVPITLNQWNFVGLVYNSSGLFEFVNGNLTYSYTTIAGETLKASSSAFRIGTEGGIYFNGSVDDIMVYNKSLTSSEVNHLYKSQLTKYDSQNWSYNYTYENASNGNYSSNIFINDIYNLENSTSKVYYFIDATNPNITNLLPSNDSIQNSSTVNFNANLTDDVGLINATLNIMNKSDNTIITHFIEYVAGEKSVVQTWNVNLKNGEYNWWIEVWDDEGKQTVSGNYTLTINYEPVHIFIKHENHFILKENSHIKLRIPSS